MSPTNALSIDVEDYFQVSAHESSFHRKDWDKIEHRIELPVDYPTSLAFGGAQRDQLYVTSVSIEFGQTKPTAAQAGALLRISGLGVTGEREPRFAV